MKKDAVSIVKHSENEKSATKTTKNTVKSTVSILYVHVHCFLCLKRAKMNPSADPGDPADPVHGLPLGTSPTRAGGQDDVSSQANSLKLSLASVDVCEWVMGPRGSRIEDARGSRIEDCETMRMISLLCTCVISP